MGGEIWGLGSVGGGGCCITSIQLAPGGIWFLFIRHSQGVILYPRLLSPWRLQAASWRKEKKRTRESHKAQSRDAFGWRQKWHIACAQTLADAALHTAIINTRRKKEGALFNLCHSTEFCGLGCKGPVNTHCNAYNNILLWRSRTMQTKLYNTFPVAMR